MGSIYDLLPDDAQDFENLEVSCPNCGEDEDLSAVNNGMVSCQNEGCSVYNFDPRE